MNEKTLNKLEYPKIIKRLTELASSASGRTLCQALTPSVDLAEIETAQQQTGAAFSRIIKKGRPSFSGVVPVIDSIRRLEIGGALSAKELLSLCRLLETAAQIKAYGRAEDPDQEPDCLSVFFDSLEPLTPLSSHIRFCILQEDEINDEASRNLKQIRRQISQLNDRVHSALASVLNGSSRQYLQEAIITMRGDRYCLPVKAEYRNQIPGLIHDQSATGSTIFVEPMAVVRLNNDLKDLFAKEQEEIQILLATLSQEAAPYASLILSNFQLLTQLDFIFAKGALALDMNASLPRFNTEGRIHIRQGRHPLLPAASVVPITVTLGDAFHLLIVTGPNTGGKTVSLKTVGLFTLMGQAGLHIPALDRSELALFRCVYADIGDEQSIEQSLSTFSSHKTNIVSFLEEADKDCLVLFDELGAGTDPTEGAALATAILKHLHQKQVRTMATTHYSELKVFALTTEGVENACCEFDVETLRPTYRLLVGIPGKSNAFAIASKLGLSGQVIDSAKQLLSRQDEAFEDLLSRLEQNRRTLQEEKEQISAYKKELELLKSQALSQQEKLDAQKDRILREAKEKARLLLEEAKDVADETIRNFHKFGKEGMSASAMEKEREKIRKQLSSVQPSMPAASRKKKPQDPASFKPGESVRVISMNLTGTITSKPDPKGNISVQMGIFNSQVPLSDLELLEEPVSYSAKKLHTTSKGKLKMGKSFSVRPEINLLGLTVDEAVAQLDKYLDDAALAGLSPVRVVHGKGTGALRTGVHSYLRRQKRVKSFRLGSFGEGDAGVTIVELKS
ncbi:endonuclease MutS2 [Suipraeoptans intestinalis]|uniref:endonuclease MutS2 n=1 Tax=Suipraeoptans intestinalis TaxID=2606628 RepID=UPI0023F385B7|nr:endonuclease MutS2 [Suipraeoptans intestinalis]MDD7770071.1 endonuclease MutS2 [Suipraeoptans intestinalis]